MSVDESDKTVNELILNLDEQTHAQRAEGSVPRAARGARVEEEDTWVSTRATKTLKRAGPHDARGAVSGARGRRHRRADS